MSASSSWLAARFTELVALFNRQQIDLPHRGLTEDCVLRLNGRAYHEHLGHPPTDPLVRLMACGPAGYRLLLAALRHAIHQPVLHVHSQAVDSHAGDDRTGTFSARATLEGTLRSQPGSFRAECMVTLAGDGTGRVREIAVTMGDADVEALLAARRR